MFRTRPLAKLHTVPPDNQLKFDSHNFSFLIPPFHPALIAASLMSRPSWPADPRNQESRLCFTPGCFFKPPPLLASFSHSAHWNSVPFLLLYNSFRHGYSAKQPKESVLIARCGNLSCKGGTTASILNIRNIWLPFQIFLILCWCWPWPANN